MAAFYNHLTSYGLFQPRTGTSPNKPCRLINSLSLSAFLP
ncbi:hypothetical protein NC653_025587 [Populus alba x Populus x berolinensis]|uniref:Uncharacterized protein n=1 Tax=Populus alba x Populus x berolinensis TaxID=444605 RepID=A0AAD6MBK7_9ROSI|nr:hypothetical protein NC653_025587 [Populus alba x Populus x berolinensis]